jgi:hypothetical protein
MTEPTPRTDDPETGYRSHYAEHEHNQELCRTLERQCARQSALLRDILNDPRVLPEWIGELIKRELEGKS